MSISKAVPVVFEHYDVPDGVEGPFKATCKHCRTPISGSTKATSNFLLHLKVLTEVKCRLLPEFVFTL